ncbi:MAG: septum formation initiator family protein [Fimbriimonadales bacterium]|jgi:cell division protein FtsB|nr:septum formation initiator family protein [Fimbriimonadales bacterium]GBC89476.1 hypothetical protein HRbin14_00201 [bacterium HR14]GIV13438.1 MAG: hypothetical protein KatS3mg021_1720 [Fimbriimonadales bacterium]CUU11171.1 Septum formation initiator [Armatimonadetes bacterium GBS]CUU36067.1 Septum formation initiator [Armatimonadetes bacterium GXS]
MTHKRLGLMASRLCLWGGVLLLGWKLLPQSVHVYSLWAQTREEVRWLEAERAALQQEQQTLRAQLQRLSTPLGKEALARERGWLMPGEKPLQIHLNE